MNGEMMFEAVTGISDSFIEEADPDTNVIIRPWYRRVRPYMSLAAAFVLVLGLAAVYQHYGAKNVQIVLDRADMKVSSHSAEDDSAADLFAVTETDSANGESGGKDPGSPMEEVPAEAEEAKSVFEREKADEEATEPEAPQSFEPSSEPADQFEFSGMADLPKGMPCAISWNDQVYEPELILVDALRDGVVPVSEDELEFEFDAASYAGTELQVFADPEDDSAVYLAYGEGYLCYHKS